ncbi:MAG TPA: ABC transporter ATP-binding protein [Candidatus Dormibacteraeota bacterium]|nr:ABC transporter ATP-binding protein [Candidatus Dormibacteraeota bacterium]
MDFRGFRAVNDVNIDVSEGTIHALIGPNGAGKTTVFNLLSGFLRPTAGDIVFRGRHITGMEPAAIARLGIVRSFQISSIFPHLTVLDNVKVALQSKSDLPKRFWVPESATSRFDAPALELLAEVSLERYADTLAVHLSYGRKRALELAISMALKPEVLLLDEPMAGMGAEDVERMTELVRRFAAGRTVVLVEHNLSVVSALSDRITVLQRGSVLTEGTYDEVRANPQVIDAYLGGQHD